MEWAVLLDLDFEKWLLEQERGVRITILAHTRHLEEFGPAMGRPQVDTLKDSNLPNLKELRVQYQGEPWRVLFVFDPKRRAILLVGGNKRGDERWYKKNIPLAEERYKRHVAELERENGKRR